MSTTTLQRSGKSPSGRRFVTGEYVPTSSCVSQRTQSRSHSTSSCRRSQTSSRPASSSSALPSGPSDAGCRQPPDYFLPCLELLLFLALSLTVVFGFFLTVDCFTNRPLMALRPRLPPLDFEGTLAPFRLFISIMALRVAVAVVRGRDDVPRARGRRRDGEPNRA